MMGYGRSTLSGSKVTQFLNLHFSTAYGVPLESSRHADLVGGISFEIGPKYRGIK